MSIENQIEKLKRLCDPSTLPKHYFIHKGEIYTFVTDDPGEENCHKVLFVKFRSNLDNRFT